MPEHLACLTFDFDAMSLWICRGMMTPTPISRGEFGVVAAERILAALKKHDIKATWFIPGHTLETYPDICARIHAEGHEIAHHGYAHEPPATLSREQEEAVIVRGREAVRQVSGDYPRGYRSPSFDLSPHTVELLIKYGFVYDSSMMGNDYTPYRCRQGDVITADKPAQFGKTTRLLEIPVAWSLDDFPHFEYLRMPNSLQQGLNRAGDVLDNWVDDFHYMTQIMDWGVLTYTFHPQVVGRGHRMLMLERLIRALFDLGATFVTMEAAAEAANRRAELGELR